MFKKLDVKISSSVIEEESYVSKAEFSGPYYVALKACTIFKVLVAV